MKQAWEWLKANWKAVASVVGTIVGYIVLKDKFQAGLKAKLKNQETVAKDAVLEERKSHIEQDRAAEEARANELRNQLGKGSNQDALDFWNRKK